MEQIGTLNKRWGLKGYFFAEIGHPVYNYNGSYMIVLQPRNPAINSKPAYVPFRKEDLTPLIDFNKQ